MAEPNIKTVQLLFGDTTITLPEGAHTLRFKGTAIEILDARGELLDTLIRLTAAEILEEVGDVPRQYRPR